MLRLLAAIPAAMSGGSALTVSSLFGGLAAAQGGAAMLDGASPAPAQPMRETFADALKDFWGWRREERERGSRYRSIKQIDADIAGMRSLSPVAKQRLMYERTLREEEEREWQTLLKRFNMGWM